VAGFVQLDEGFLGPRRILIDDHEPVKTFEQAKNLAQRRFDRGEAGLCRIHKVAQCAFVQHLVIDDGQLRGVQQIINRRGKTPECGSVPQQPVRVTPHGGKLVHVEK
jgi:hypothetical protein